MVCLLDPEWAAMMDGIPARVNDNGYVVVGDDNERLHRVIMDPAPGQQVDHINGDKLDNRRANLRLADNSENNANKPTRGRWRGVYRNAGRYEAKIKEGGKLSYLGRFDAPEAAARAYDDAAVLLFGQFAVLNFPGK